MNLEQEKRDNETEGFNNTNTQVHLSVQSVSQPRHFLLWGAPCTIILNSFSWSSILLLSKFRCQNLALAFDCISCLSIITFYLMYLIVTGKVCIRVCYHDVLCYVIFSIPNHVTYIQIFPLPVH
jgi:hypothetical protein